jgi:hypothetical protein
MRLARPLGGFDTPPTISMGWLRSGARSAPAVFLAIKEALSGSAASKAEVPDRRRCGWSGDRLSQARFWFPIPFGRSASAFSEWRVIHPERVPGSICIPPAPDASASTLPARAPCAGVRVQRSKIREQKSGIAKFTLDIDRQSTTIRLWINWVQHSLLCLIQPGGG